MLIYVFWYVIISWGGFFQDTYQVTTIGYTDPCSGYSGGLLSGSCESVYVATCTYTSDQYGNVQGGCN